MNNQFPNLKPLYLSGTLLTSLLLSSAQATTFDPYNDINPAAYSGTGEELSVALTGADNGIHLVSGSSSFQGNFDGSQGGNFDGPEEGFGGEYGSASFFSNLDFGSVGETDFVLPEGILLTSGNAAPATTNTESGFSGVASGFGDDGLDELLATLGTQAEGEFPDGEFGTYQSSDATVLSFDFTVDPNINAISLDFIFGTEEYSEYVDDYPEIAAIFIDGVNYAGFSDGSLLTLTSATVGSGNFFNNDIHDNDSDPANPVTPLNIEYDGVSAPLTLHGLLDTSLTTHSIKIAVSDTSDDILDTGLFVANLQGLTLGSDDGSGTASTDPLLPTTEEAGNFEFVIDVGDAGFGIDPSQPLFIDPFVATGYEYEVSGSNFATVQIPNCYGDVEYNLYYWNGTGYVSVGTIGVNDPFNFLDIDPSGVTKFMIDGIEIAANLDPTDSLAFITGVTFTGGGQLIVSQTAIETCDGNIDCSNAVPEPHIFLLFASGLIGLMVTRRKYLTKA
ncbi:MAG: PEP-CTERM sorting domain-containing protein [Gammaproteobacteria bacterium]|nr:PEP-CTERM sorting domain-containing protein [Gammaproteobacteria bacterium]